MKKGENAKFCAPLDIDMMARQESVEMWNEVVERSEEGPGAKDASLRVGGSEYETRLSAEEGAYEGKPPCITSERRCWNFWAVWRGVGLPSPVQTRGFGEGCQDLGAATAATFSDNVWTKI